MANDIPESFRNGLEEIKRRFEEDSNASQAKAKNALQESLDSLNVEIPMSLKAILDRGGAVRQIVMRRRENMPGTMSRPEIDVRADSEFERMNFYELRGGVVSYRITIIVEPLDSGIIKR